MSLREQNKYFEALRRFETKLERKDSEDYKMLLSRHKDDEDLDILSMNRLRELYTKYYLDRQKKNYDSYFKKSPGE
jgi:hypothetical protein